MAGKAPDMTYVEGDMPSAGGGVPFVDGRVPRVSAVALMASREVVVADLVDGRGNPQSTGEGNADMAPAFLPGVLLLLLVAAWMFVGGRKRRARAAVRKRTLHIYICMHAAKNTVQGAAEKT